MKKRISAMVLAMVVFAAILPVTVLAGAESAVRSAQNFTVNGKTVNCEKYNIDGSNYFKLRDLAYLLNGTKDQFFVGYDDRSGTVSVENGKAYTAVGGELEIGEDRANTAVLSAQTILINGKQVTDISVYNIGGNNYFKLRDLGDCVGFYVDYDAAANTAIVITDTKKETEALSNDCIHESISDANGNLLFSRYSYNDGTNIDEYTYDANGNRRSEKTIKKSEYGDTMVCTYDANGNCLTKSSTSFDGSWRNNVYTYDANGNLLSQTYRDSYGFGEDYVCTYDANGNRSSLKYTRHDGYGYRIVYTYDADGNLLSEKHTDANGTAPDETIDYTYDATGNILSRNSVRSDGFACYTVYTYDADGRILSESSSYSTGGSNIRTYTYDENGNLLSEKYTYSDGIHSYD